MPPLTSIVILTRNELPYTKLCIESIARCTPEPHELVLVDNGSADGTVEYLRSLPGATVIVNGENLGFGGGCNQGIAAARGERVLLLNNDTVVTPGWLGALHRELDASPRHGLVGARSNHVTGAQKVDGCGYDVEGLDGLDAFAADWCHRHRGQGWPLVRIIGFCILMRRELIDAIGGFDVRFGLGNFEDDDLCLRAAVAGFDSRVADDAYVHHFGSRSFIGNGIDYTALLQENWARFRSVWGLGDDDVDEALYGYRPEPVIAATRYARGRHYAPLVARLDGEQRADFAARGTSVLVPCDRLDPAATSEALRQVLALVEPRDDVTVVVRIDPRDAAAGSLLDAAADAVGDAHVPDVVVVEARDENDEAVLRACDLVVAHGRLAAARAGHARFLGTPAVPLDGLPDALAAGRRASMGAGRPAA